MTVKMSSEGDTSKNLSPEANEKSGTDHTDSSQDSQDVADLKSSKPTENNTDGSDTESKNKEDLKEECDESAEKSENENSKNDADEKAENDVEKKEKNETKENDVKDEEEDAENSEKTEEEDEEEDESSSKDKKDSKDKGKSKEVPLLDQPLEKSGKRERKNVQRFNEPPVEKEGKFEMPNGSGTPLGEIPRIDASISRFKNDDLKVLHRILFKVVGKTTHVKKNIKKFNGFEFKKDSEEYTKKLAHIQKLEVKLLKSICEMLDLTKTGTKEELSDRILSFLIEPADSGKPAGGGRPKRTAAVKANNRGYSSHDDYSSDEKPSRARRDKGKRSSLKDATSSESDEEFQPSDGSEEKPRVTKRKRTPKKKGKSDDEGSDDAEQSGGSSDESDGEPKGKRKKTVAKVNNKTKGKATPAKRGRKPAAAASAKKTPKSKKKESSEDEASDKGKDGDSSSEDEPLAKKAKSTNPPTDDEIKAYIKEILEGANLEEITMKNVCQKVYAHYPDFNLSHKKDFIKSTVKSLIST